MCPDTRPFPRGTGQRAGCPGPARQMRPETGCTLGGPGGSADPGPRPMMGQCPLGAHLPAQRQGRGPSPRGESTGAEQAQAGVSTDPNCHPQGPRGRKCGPSSAALESQLPHSATRQEAVTPGVPSLSHGLPEIPLTPSSEPLHSGQAWGPQELRENGQF